MFLSSRRAFSVVFFFGVDNATRKKNKFYNMCQNVLTGFATASKNRRKMFCGCE